MLITVKVAILETKSRKAIKMVSHLMQLPWIHLKLQF